MSLVVLQTGLLDTVQDVGRFGYQHLGVGPAGPADPLSHRLANLLVGNAGGEAALEVTLRGPTLRLEADAVVAFAGAPFPLTVDGRRLPRSRTLVLRAGACLAIGAAAEGLRGYLAVAGGLAVPEALGSAATDLRGGFGGLGGRPLRNGDRLPLNAPGPAPAALLAGLRRTTGAGLAARWGLPWSGPLPGPRRYGPLGLIPGPHWDLLDEASRASLLRDPFRVGAASDRMGLRLQGPALRLEPRSELLSSAVATGTLQLPPDGQPILLLADRQTTGGYPRLGELATVDLPFAAQARPGDPLRFRRVEFEEARRDLRRQERDLAFLGGRLRAEFLQGVGMGPCDRV